MEKQIMQLIIIALTGIGIFAWGINGIINKNKIKNRSDYILAGAQVIGGVIIFIFVALYAIFRMQH